AFAIGNPLPKHRSWMGRLQQSCALLWWVKWSLGIDDDAGVWWGGQRRSSGNGRGGIARLCAIADAAADGSALRAGGRRHGRMRATICDRSENMALRQRELRAL